MAEDYDEKLSIENLYGLTNCLHFLAHVGLLQVNQTILVCLGFSNECFTFEKNPSVMGKPHPLSLWVCMCVLCTGVDVQRL
jgi:hypothetical protein